MSELHASTPTSKRIELWLLWLILVLIGYYALYSMLQKDSERTEQQIEQTMVLSASHYAQKVGDALAQRINLTQSVAENTSVKLYLSTTEEKTSKEKVEASIGFLRNYIMTMAQQYDLVPLQGQMEDVRANIDVLADRGIAVVDAQMKPIVATSGFPDASHVWSDESYNGQSLILQSNALWLRAPIYPVQSDDVPIGWVLMTLPMQISMDVLLKESSIQKLMGSAYIVAEQDVHPTILAPKDAVHYLNKESVIYRAFYAPRNLLSGEDVAGKPAYAYAEPIREASWQLIYVMSHDAAFAAMQDRHFLISAVYWISMLSITLVIVALWRHLTSEKLQDMMKDLQAHQTLLHMITSRIPMRLMIVDAKQRVRYANDELVRSVNLPSDDVLGKRLNQLMSVSHVEKFERTCDKVLQKDVEESIWHEVDGPAGIEVASDIQMIPLNNVPDAFSAADGRGVLIIEHDLTQIMQDKQTNQRMLMKLVDTLVMLVDQRDPNASNHSACVSYIARAIAQTMALDELHVNAVSIAGRLMNIGKILVPQALLTSDKRLDEHDRDKIAQCLQASVDYLQHIPFEGPVLETLRQSYERLDGSGPLGLKGSFILPTAQILAVANSFVAISSPRAYRAGKDTPETISILEGQAGTDYDESVILALKHYMVNLGGRVAWRQFREDAEML